MPKSNNGKPMEIKPDQELSNKQPREESKILNVLLAHEDVLYKRLRDYQRKKIMAKRNDRDKAGGQIP